MTTTLLLIEDSLTTQKVVQTTFPPAEVEIVTANDAAAALHLLRTVVPDVVIADAFLPGIDGFHLCQIIRETMGLRQVPVILLTSNFTPYDEKRGEQVGVTTHLPKPFEAQTLRQLVQQLVASPTTPSGPAFPPAAASPAASGSQEGAVTSGERNGAATQARPSPPAPQPDPAAELAAIVSQWTPGLLAHQAAAEEGVHQALGRTLLQLFQETLTLQLSKMMEQLTPQLLAAVHEVVATKTADLLEVLLQREIDKLRHAMEDHESDGV
jgi:CheY-like chemotaxis protein